MSVFDEKYRVVGVERDRLLLPWSSQRRRANHRQFRTCDSSHPGRVSGGQTDCSIGPFHHASKLRDQPARPQSRNNKAAAVSFCDLRNLPNQHPTRENRGSRVNLNDRTVEEGVCAADDAATKMTRPTAFAECAELLWWQQLRRPGERKPRRRQRRALQHQRQPRFRRRRSPPIPLPVERGIDHP